MNRIVVIFALAFFFGTLLSAILEGGGGFASTRLASAMSETVTSATVVNTSGFLRSSYYYIGDEKVKYTGTTDTGFTGLTRGYDGTTATAHGVGDKVYSPDVNVLNAALGFEVTTTGAKPGSMSIPVAAWRFVTVSMPRLITWDYAWLEYGNLAYLRMLFAFMSIGFVVYVSLYIAMALGGILQGAFKR